MPKLILEIVPYAFLDISEKHHQFLSSIKNAHKRNLVPVFLPRGVADHGHGRRQSALVFRFFLVVSLSTHQLETEYTHRSIDHEAGWSEY